MTVLDTSPLARAVDQAVLASSSLSPDVIDALANVLPDEIPERWLIPDFARAASCPALIHLRAEPARDPREVEAMLDALRQTFVEPDATSWRRAFVRLLRSDPGLVIPRIAERLDDPRLVARGSWLIFHFGHLGHVGADARPFVPRLLETMMKLDAQDLVAGCCLVLSELGRVDPSAIEVELRSFVEDEQRWWTEAVSARHWIAIIGLSAGLGELAWIESPVDLILGEQWWFEYPGIWLAARALTIAGRTDLLDDLFARVTAQTSEHEIPFQQRVERVRAAAGLPSPVPTLLRAGLDDPATEVQIMALVAIKRFAVNCRPSAAVALRERVLELAIECSYDWIRAEALRCIRHLIIDERDGWNEQLLASLDRRSEPIWWVADELDVTRDAVRAGWRP